jgi:methyl-accepting chemotaxis protein
MRYFGIHINDIKSRLLASFITIIVVLSCATFFVVGLTYNVELQYQTIIQNLIFEYRITETSSHLVDLYTSFLQNTNNKNILVQYNSTNKELDTIFATLKNTITYDKSTVVYNRLLNSKNFIEEYCERGIKAGEARNFSDTLAIFNQVTTGKINIQNDTGLLILAELDYAQQKQQSLQILQLISWIVGITLFLCVATGSVIFAVTFSRRMSAPLIILSNLAKKIAEGDLSTQIPQTLLKSEDEIGSLSRLIDIMVKKLQEKIVSVEKSNQSLNQKAEEEKRLNDTMIGRELKIIEQKKEIERLNEKINLLTKRG